MSKHSTICKDCVFAEVEENVQQGCNLNKLAIYQQKGITAGILTSTSKKTGVKDTHFFLHNFVCPMYRDWDWYDKQKEGTDLVQAIKTENKLDFAVLIFDDGTVDVPVAINRLVMLNIQPSFITVVLRSDSKYDLEEITNLLKDTEIRYKTYKNVIKEPDALDYGVSKLISLNNPFLAIIRNNTEFNPNCINDLTDDIQERLIRFSYAYTKDFGMLVFPRESLIEILHNSSDLEKEITECPTKHQI